MVISTLILKVIISSAIVITLSIIAEKSSPSISGILSGYPLGTAVVLFFYGYEVSPDFAAQSAVFTLLGLISTQAFLYAYYKCSLKCTKFSPIFCSILAFFVFFTLSSIMQKFEFSNIGAIITSVISIPFFIVIFRNLPDVKIKDRKKLGVNTIFLRAIWATLIIIVITSIPEIIGKKWAGLFSGFPITLFPLILIMHMTYKKEHAHSIIKNFPKGLMGLILYVISIHKLYPVIGIYLGTLLSLIVATIFLVLVLHIKQRGLQNSISI